MAPFRSSGSITPESRFSAQVTVITLPLKEHLKVRKISVEKKIYLFDGFLDSFAIGYFFPLKNLIIKKVRRTRDKKIKRFLKFLYEWC